MSDKHIPNWSAPERAFPPYSGDQTATWSAGTPGAVKAKGVQPTSDNNPAGTAGSFTIMGMTLAIWSRLCGPQ